MPFRCRRTYLSLACVALALSVTGCDLSGVGESFGAAIAKVVVCGTLGQLEDPDGSVVHRGTADAAYVIRKDHAPAPLMLGTSGRVDVVGISTPAEPYAGDGQVVRIRYLQSAPAEQCWAEGDLDALAVGSSDVVVTGGEVRVAARVEVAAPARFVLSHEQGSFDETQPLELRVGEVRSFGFRVLDESGRDLAFLEPLEWSLPAGLVSTAFADADNPPAGVDEVSITGPEATLVARRAGEVTLTVAFGWKRARFRIRVLSTAPHEDASVDASLDAQTQSDASADAATDAMAPTDAGADAAIDTQTPVDAATNLAPSP